MVHLGHNPEERSSLQEVLISIEFFGIKNTDCETSDSLEDTFCYGQVCQSLINHCQNRSFALVEKLGRELFDLLKEKQPSASFKLSIKKVKPPIPQLKGGVEYLMETSK